MAIYRRESPDLRRRSLLLMVGGFALAILSSSAVASSNYAHYNHVRAIVIMVRSYVEGAPSRDSVELEAHAAMTMRAQLMAPRPDILVVSRSIDTEPPKEISEIDILYVMLAVNKDHAENAGGQMIGAVGIELRRQGERFSMAGYPFLLVVADDQGEGIRGAIDHQLINVVTTPLLEHGTK